MESTHSGRRRSRSSRQDRNKLRWRGRSCRHLDRNISPGSPVRRNPEDKLKDTDDPLLACISSRCGIFGVVKGRRGSYAFHRRFQSIPPGRCKRRSHGRTTHCCHTDNDGDSPDRTYLQGTLRKYQTHTLDSETSDMYVMFYKRLVLKWQDPTI